jgi:two-component system, sporulation sensor kinase D
VGFDNIFMEDDGTGIDFRDKEKIFDTFWTTKLNGTGMGLSVCKEIMNDHMGNIELVGSTKNKTVFKLSFYKGEANK